jgi:hypothetical protein
MQFAACTRRTFLTVSPPGFFPLTIAAQTSHSTAAVAAKRETVEPVCIHWNNGSANAVPTGDLPWQ